jgi:hypothetical protein
MRSPVTRVVAFASALLNLTVAGLAPLADASAERAAAAAFAQQAAEEAGAPASPEQAPVHTHGDCIFCVSIRAAADLPLPVAFYAAYHSDDPVASFSIARPASRELPSTGRPRAPPATHPTA